MGGDTTSRMASSSSAPFPTETPVVLVVDDDEPIRFALSCLIEELGYTFMEAENGRQALDLAQRYQPALIITDFMMPYLSGAELIAAVRSNEQALQRRVPIILFSAAGSRQIENTDADIVLAKPFEVSALEHAIHRLLPTT